MPDLEQQAVTTWLTQLRPDPAGAERPPAIRRIESQADMPMRLALLGAAFDDFAPDRLHGLAGALRHASLRDDLSTVLAQLGAARVLRLLHWLAEVDIPACHAVTAALLQDDDSAGHALRAAVLAVTRQATLRRVFSPERIAALETACAFTVQDAA